MLINNISSNLGASAATTTWVLSNNINNNDAERAIAWSEARYDCSTTLPQERPSDDEPLETPLRRFDNVLLTPHIGGNTAEAQDAIGVDVAEKLLRYSDNGSSLGAVNFPEVALPEHAGRHRILHVHRNEPGVLASINSLLAGAEVNVASQYLETTAQIGYAVIDIDRVDRPVSARLRESLAEIPATIRTRVLY